MQTKPPPKPRFCVYCGILLPDGDDVKRCPGCGELIPARFQPAFNPSRSSTRPVDVDTTISFCIHCGEFLDKASFSTGICKACRKDLPRAPSPTTP
ncbi:MAG: hypothetical protein GYA24_21005 [Candidatus Lokiarchaeota archaeon]|nr:hypothetical protein [Candidatus Lokiarchaeota archaeon]